MRIHVEKFSPKRQTRSTEAQTDINSKFHNGYLCLGAFSVIGRNQNRSSIQHRDATHNPFTNNNVINATIMISTKLCTTILLCFYLGACQSFTPSKHPTKGSDPAFTSKTAVKYQNEGEISGLEQPLPAKNIPRPSKRTKFFVEDVTTLDELKYFLEQDERVVVIKFYAKWCKKCQQVGRSFDRLAMEMGDRVVDQLYVDGDVRFAAVEYNPKSQSFITEDLQVQGVPTLQMYVGTRKLLDAGSDIKKVRSELEVVGNLSHGELLERVESSDDGVLQSLIEQSFFDSPDFLNEEW